MFWVLLGFTFFIWELDLKINLEIFEMKKFNKTKIEKAKLIMCVILIYFHKTGFLTQISKGFRPYGIINSPAV